MAETTEQYRNRINQLKTGIENEPYIKKMRENIAEGISKTGNRQADIEVRQDTLEEDFVAVQQDASSASPSGAEVAVARAGFNTLDERLTTKEQQVNAQLAQNETYDQLEKNLFLNKPKKEGIFHIAGGIDSLTAGANGRFSDRLNAVLKGKYGAGGAGYIRLSKEKDVTHLDVVEKIEHTGLNFLRDIKPLGTGLASYSLDTFGFYTENADGSPYYHLDASREKWTKARLFYLNQSGGGSFQVGYAGSTKKNVTTNGENNLGYVELGNRPKGVGYNKIEIDNIIGNVCIFAVYLYGEKGFIFSNISLPGEHLHNVATLNADFRKKWVSLLNLDLYLFNGGTNDEVSDDQYATDLKNYLEPFKLEDVPILITRPNPMNYSPLNEKINGYEQKMIDYAKENAFGFTSNYRLFGGSYAEAIKQGLMSSDDGTHPISLGYEKIANNYLNLLNVDYTNVVLWNYWTWLSNGGESSGGNNPVYGFKTTLDDVYSILNSGKTAEILKFKLNQANINSLLSFTVLSNTEWEKIVEKTVVEVSISHFNSNTPKLDVGTPFYTSNVTNDNTKVEFSINTTTNIITISVKNNYSAARNILITNIKFETPQSQRMVPFVDKL